MLSSVLGAARRAILGAVLAAGAVAGCTDERIVFREPVNPPPDESSGFLGYFTASERQTTCGNCHIGQQSEWENTAHAGAYETLANSPGAQDFCFSCHTVNERGNALSGAAGWDVVKDEAYHDVQCESCHGPGFAHAQNPDNADNVPLASISVTIDGDNGCGECHNGTHHPFVEEWSASRHATKTEGAATRAECIGCHTAQGALQSWGVRANFVEAEDAVEDYEPIVCAVCHDPHGGRNGLEPGSGEGGPGSVVGQLRFPIDIPSQEQNLCVKCHHKRAEPETESATIRGPHSPEGPLLLGEGAGWFPPNFIPEIAQIRGTHGSEANPRLCAQCHVQAYDVTDQSSGAFVVRSVGHRFEAIPCVDANGAPTGAEDCPLTERRFASCTASGCHGTQDAARAAFTTANARIAALTAEIDAILALPQLEADNVRNDGRFTVADGAWFNSELGKLRGSPTHNPFLLEQLLLATIEALETTYGVTAPVTGVSLTRQLQ